MPPARTVCAGASSQCASGRREPVAGRRAVDSRHVPQCNAVRLLAQARGVAQLALCERRIQTTTEQSAPITACASSRSCWKSDMKALRTIRPASIVCLASVESRVVLQQAHAHHGRPAARRTRNTPRRFRLPAIPHGARPSRLRRTWIARVAPTTSHASAGTMGDVATGRPL